jgi:hypothetical protein
MKEAKSHLQQSFSTDGAIVDWSLDRRLFLQHSAVMAAAWIVPWLHACHGNNKAAIPLPDFLSHTIDQETLQAIGKAYILSFPDENKPETLVSQLMNDFPATQKATENTLREFFNKQIAQDFAAGNLVIISGWVLSRTEARQCALYSINVK